MRQRASVAVVDGRIMLSAQAERAGASSVHSRRSWLHRLLWLREVRAVGYCCDCINTACDAFDAMTGQVR